MIKLENIKPNFHRVFINDFCFWFSYETIVAYKAPEGATICSENKWTVTTGKHLNEIEPDRNKRWKASIFEKAVETLQIEIK